MTFHRPRICWLAWVLPLLCWSICTAEARAGMILVAGSVKAVEVSEAGMAAEAAPQLLHMTEERPSEGMGTEVMFLSSSSPAGGFLSSDVAPLVVPPMISGRVTPDQQLQVPAPNRPDLLRPPRLPL